MGVILSKNKKERQRFQVIGCFSRGNWLTVLSSRFLLPSVSPYSLVFTSTQAFSFPEADLWWDPIFWACAEFSFRILSQSDLSDLTASPWIADIRCWTSPEVTILGRCPTGARPLEMRMKHKQKHKHVRMLRMDNCLIFGSIFPRFSEQKYGGRCLY